MNRERALREVAKRVAHSRVTAITGPRQAGKTTLVRAFAKRERARGVPVYYFDLEDPLDLARLDAPRLALTRPGLTVIDEVQRRPDLFPILRVLVDEDPSRRFVVLGSAAGDLLRQSSESLAGRVSYYELMPFAAHEVRDSRRAWVRGGYPRAYLPPRRTEAFQWLDDYIATVLERDVPTLGVRIPAATLRRFWAMLAHVSGHALNSSALARSMGVSDKTIRHYVDVLTDMFLVRQLAPWFANIGKRQVRAPKVYLRDSGVMHALLGIRSYEALERSPHVGLSWEGFALENVLRQLGVRSSEAYFWATHADAELDLLVNIGGKRIGFEFKRTDAPKVTRSMRIALHDLELSRLYVVHPGSKSFPLADDIGAVAMADVFAAGWKP